MSTDPNENVYAAPLADVTGAPAQTPPEFVPDGFPHPLVLAWMGVVLAIGIIGNLFLLGASFLPTLMIVPIRLVWVIYTRRQMRLYEATWQPGVRTFVMGTWIINVALLCLDAFVILMIAVCFAVLIP
jgi:hypothetical protein